MHIDRPTNANYTESQAFQGAIQILGSGMGLLPGEKTVFIIDETTVDPGRILVEAAYQLRLDPACLLMPAAIQRQASDFMALSLQAEDIARSAHAILLCVGDAPDCALFRKQVLKQYWGVHTRMGLMPGVDRRVLAWAAHLDWPALSQTCRRVERVLARGRQAELITYELSGQAHTLHMELGGWERLPVASDGIIRDGSWGNVPSGETYINPLEGRSHGTVVVNGSLPGYVLAEGEEAVLTFEDGCLQQIEPPDGPLARHLYEKVFLEDRVRGEDAWRCLAEFGIGLNPQVATLTGNMLADEKMAGTAHIALGGNDVMGGTLPGRHCDLLLKSPTVRVDGQLLMLRGSLLDDRKWDEHYSEVDLAGSPVLQAETIARSGTQAEEQAGRLVRVLRSEPGRVSRLRVGDDETAELAAKIYRRLPVDGSFLRIVELLESPDDGQLALNQILHLLWEYELVRFR